MLDAAGVHPGHLRDDGLRPDRGVPGRGVPGKIRYTSFSLPYHIGNGWFGGTLPLIAGLLVEETDNKYAGLYWVDGRRIDDVPRRNIRAERESPHGDLERGGERAAV